MTNQIHACEPRTSQNPALVLVDHHVAWLGPCPHVKDWRNKEWPENSRRRTRRWCLGLSTRFSTGETTRRPSDFGHRDTFNIALTLLRVARACSI